MVGDLPAVIKVTTCVAASMTYARFASLLTNPGKLRLLSLLPIIILLPFLPLSFNSINLRGTSAFFLTWLATFKLLLLSFGVGPLSPSLSLINFIAISSLPVKISKKIDHSSGDFLLPACLKLTVFALILPLYQYKSQIHPWLTLAIYSVYIYLCLEIIFIATRFLAGLLLGLELEAQVDAPFKSQSLQDFWGRRWNLMVTGILRPSVYNPISSRFGAATGVMATFVVSGIMHEVVFYYLTSERPRGEVSLFFVVHGICLVVEGKMREKGWWRVENPVVRTVVTLGFVMATAFWSFFPPLLRAGVDEKGLGECAAVLRLVEDGGKAVLTRFFS